MCTDCRKQPHRWLDFFFSFSNVCVSITYGWRRWEGEYSPFLTHPFRCCVSVSLRSIPPSRQSCTTTTKKRKKLGTFGRSYFLLTRSFRMLCCCCDALRRNLPGPVIVILAVVRGREFVLPTPPKRRGKVLLFFLTLTGTYYYCHYSLSSMPMSNSWY
jgi:hypothetical protein